MEKKILNLKPSTQLLRRPSGQLQTANSMNSLSSKNSTTFSSSPLFGPVRKISKRSIPNLSSFNNIMDHGTVASSANILKSISELDSASLNKDINYSETNIKDNWHIICIKVLPLFNGQGLQDFIEDLNDLVKRCMEVKTPKTLAYNINELLKNGIYTINTKLIEVTDNSLISRLVEIWTFFFDSIMPYIKGIFLPLSFDPRYSILDIPRMAFTCFRDFVILPNIDRIEEVLNMQFTGKIPIDPQFNTISGRFIQMLSILYGILDEKQQSIYNVLKILRANTNGNNRMSYISLKKTKKYPLTELQY
ncbi:HbrB-domain-containing protein [Piromyces finnis]|uniref:HbrB-domain-containing protein n=1 Tax=Piromyces finnis TaxID=1754191 RepID=A0A1Y1VCZ6_9FUNG|nr:HbrB-domain-containing protein [Piromyces finnis]|eukprot:ORX52548.1 HbrB-domain-containing protein [Piromyces finnis]